MKHKVVTDPCSSNRHNGKNEYRCCRCEELGKSRVIRVVNDIVVGRKDPEIDHHCVPVPKSTAEAQKIDREMRHEVCNIL